MLLQQVLSVHPDYQPYYTVGHKKRANLFFL